MHLIARFLTRLFRETAFQVGVLVLGSALFLAPFLVLPFEAAFAIAKVMFGGLVLFALAAILVSVARAIRRR